MIQRWTLWLLRSCRCMLRQQSAISWFVVIVGMWQMFRLGFWLLRHCHCSGAERSALHSGTLSFPVFSRGGRDSVLVCKSELFGVSEVSSINYSSKSTRNDSICIAGGKCFVMFGAVDLTPSHCVSRRTLAMLRKQLTLFQLMVWKVLSGLSCRLCNGLLYLEAKTLWRSVQWRWQLIDNDLSLKGISTWCSCWVQSCWLLVAVLHN